MTKFEFLITDEQMMTMSDKLINTLKLLVQSIHYGGGYINVYCRPYLAETVYYGKYNEGDREFGRISASCLLQLAENSIKVILS